MPHGPFFIAPRRLLVLRARCSRRKPLIGERISMATETVGAEKFRKTALLG